MITALAGRQHIAAVASPLARLEDELRRLENFIGKVLLGAR